MKVPKEITRSKVLVVDDQPANTVLFEKILTMEGFTFVYTTSDPRNVLSLYKEIEPDIVLLDIRMPYMDGFAVLEQLKSNVDPLFLCVLILTAQQDMETRLAALERGAKDFIEKPFNRAELISRMSNLLEAQLMRKEMRHQNKILEELVKDRTLELLETQREILKRLCKASEYRDGDTGLHITRMSRYSELIGRALDLPPVKCSMLLEVSALHDIGKIGIPDTILLKPGRLTAAEFEIMKQHTVIGADMLSGGKSELMKMAEVIALTHHEKWDGTGYPHQLQRDDIPIEGRICAIADVFDALTSARPYKDAWTVDHALHEMQKGRGTHFDPKLFDLFLDILPDVVSILHSKCSEDS